MDSQILIKNNLDPILQDPQTTLETLLKNDSFSFCLKNSSNQLNLIEFLCKDENPIKILKYALLNSIDIDDFRVIHSCCMTILTSSYFNDHLLKVKFFENIEFKQYITNFPKSGFVHDNLICANYTKIIEKFICYLFKFPNEKKIIQDDFQFLQSFILSNINILSFRELCVKLTVSFPELICRNEEMFINIIQINSGDLNKLFFALQAIILILNEKPSLISLMDNEQFGIPILEIGINNYETHPLISTQAFQIFYNIKERSDKQDFFNIISNTEFKFTSLNSATANALRLFPRNAENFIYPFFELKCPTILNEQIVTIFRSSFKKQEMNEIITRYHINYLIIANFPIYIASKTNGHFLELSKIICDSKIICCSEHETEWNLFVLQKLNPRRVQANKKTEIKISTEKKYIHLSLFKQNMRPWK